MADVNYSVVSDTEEFIIDIAEGLERLLPDKSFKERCEIAGRAADNILQQGNSALYQAFVNYGIKVALQEAKRQ